MYESNNQNIDSAIFSSIGAAWQWAIDNASLHPKWIEETAADLGLSELSLIEIYKRLLDQGKPAAEIREELKAQAAQVAESDKEEYSKITAGYNLQSFRDEIAKAADEERCSTGFKNLDEALDGGLYRGLYIIGAVPSLGKTTFVLQIADQIAKQGKDVLIVSLEMDRAELTAKSLSRISFELVRKCDKKGMAKTARDILDGSRQKNFIAEEIALLDQSFDLYGQFADHVYIIEGRGNFTVNEIRAAVEKHVSITGNAPVVIIDYIQKISALNLNASDKTSMDLAVKELFWTARDFNLPVIGISSFNRAKYTGRPDMSAFKESGSIEYDADVLLAMNLKGSAADGYNDQAAKQKDPREVEISVLKNRLASVGKVLKYDYYAAYNSFIEDGVVNS